MLRHNRDRKTVATDPAVAGLQGGKLSNAILFNDYPNHRSGCPKWADVVSKMFNRCAQRLSKVSESGVQNVKNVTGDW